MRFVLACRREQSGRGADGGPLSPEYLTRTFARLIRQTGLPPVRLHDLRHGAASLALTAGADLKVIADQLGHCSIVPTADTYISVATELGLAAAEAVARLILRAGKRPPGGEYLIDGGLIKTT